MKKLLLLSFLFAQGVIFALPPGYAPASVFNHETEVPLDADCDSPSEYGRIHIQTDTPNAALWICGIGGWIHGIGSGLTHDPVTKQTTTSDESIGGDVSMVVENTATSGVSNAKVKVKAAGGGKSKVLFSDTDADRASVTSDTGDDLVFATGAALVTALTINSSQVSTFAGLSLEGSTLTDIADDEVLIGSGAGAGAFTAIPNCTTGKLLYTASTNAVSCGTDAVGTGGGGVGEYNPDNYPDAADTRLSDEFTSGPTLTWTQLNPDTQVVSYAMGGMHLSRIGNTDAWHGVTTPAPADIAEDFLFVAKMNLTGSNTGSILATDGCGITIITGGTEAVPTEMNSMYLKFTTSAVGTFVHEDHDDPDFAGVTNIPTNLGVAATNSQSFRLEHDPFWIMLKWIDATDDILSYFSFNGVTWRATGTDTTTDGYPIALGLFTRDDMGCFFEYARVLKPGVELGHPLIKIGL